MPRMREFALGVVVTAACAFVGACGLFETREPNKPPPPVSGCRALTGGPNAAVIPNIEDFYGRVSAATCYNSTLDDSFAFHPDPLDSSQALPQTPFIGWDEVVEKGVNLNIANVVDFMEVQFQGEYASPVISTDQTDRSALLRLPAPAEREDRTDRPGHSALRGPGRPHLPPGGQWRMAGDPVGRPPWCGDRLHMGSPSVSIPVLGASLSG